MRALVPLPPAAALALAGSREHGSSPRRRPRRRSRQARKPTTTAMSKQASSPRGERRRCAGSGAGGARRQSPASTARRQGASSSRRRPRQFSTPRTGAESAEEPPGLKPVRVNNRVRRALDAALGSLTLLAADPAKRLAAADAVFKARDAAALPALETALAKETDPRIKRALLEARAAVLLVKPDASDPDRVAAVETLARARRPGSRSRMLRDSPPRAARRLRPPLHRPRPQSNAASRCSSTCRTSGTGCRSARSCCSPRSGSPSPSASWASSTWPTAKWSCSGPIRPSWCRRRSGPARPALFDWSLPIAIPLAFLVAGVRRRHDRARHHPLPLWAAARNAARHLRRQPRPAAGGAHHLRPDQPRGRRAVLHERARSRSAACPSPTAGCGSSCSRSLSSWRSCSFWLHAASA